MEFTRTEHVKNEERAETVLYVNGIKRFAVRVEEGQQDRQVGQVLTRMCGNMNPVLLVLNKRPPFFIYNDKNRSPSSMFTANSSPSHQETSAELCSHE